MESGRHVQTPKIGKESAIITKHYFVFTRSKRLKMFSKSMTSKDTFLEQTKAAREERALEKKREQSAVKIQAYVRGWLARRRFLRMILYEQLYLAIVKFNVFF